MESDFKVTERPWGTYSILENKSNFNYKIKRLVINPKQKISLQKHYHRSEHWIVVSGVALVTKEDESFLVQVNESIYIPKTTIHRLENPGIIPLIVIEVQCGEYLEEDDIIRLEEVVNERL